MFLEKKEFFLFTSHKILLSFSLIVVFIFLACVNASWARDAEYAPGQLIVKFKPGVVNRSAFSVNTTYQTSSSKSSIRDELSVKFGIEISDIKPFLKKTIDIGTIKTRYRKRANRAPVNAQIPDLSNIYLLDLPQNKDIEEASGEFSHHPDVEYAHPNYIYKAHLVPNDTHYDKQWALKKIEAEGAWDVATGSSDIVVAVIDSGVDYNHEDIKDNVLRGVGYDFANNDDDPMDDYGHGTACAGIIAAVTDNSTGIAGLSWNSRIMGVKALDNLGEGSIYDLSEGIIYAAQNGADILSNSWGSSRRRISCQILEDAVKVAYGLGCIVVFSAGNDTDDVVYHSPQNMPETITVAATDMDDNRAIRHGKWSSNYGIGVDVAAPGCEVISLRAKGTSLGTSVGPDYCILDGTSMACPYVSGAAALALSYYELGSGVLKIEQVRKIIKDSADEITTDKYIGKRLNAFKALNSSDSADLIAKITNPATAQTIRGVVDIKGIAAGDDFGSYSLYYYKQGSSPSSRTQIGLSNNNSVEDNGVLFQKWNAPLIGEGSYVLELEVVDTTGTEKLNDSVVITIDALPRLEAAWYSDNMIEGIGMYSSPVLGDINGNGYLETIVGANDGYVYCFDHRLNKLWSFKTADSISSSPALGDLDKDGDLEIVIGSITDKKLYCMDHNGALLWSFHVKSNVQSTPAMVDINMDGYLEIVFGGGPGDNHVYCLDRDGSELWSYEAEWSVNSSPAIGDIDNDGDMEIVIGSNDTNLYCLDHNGNKIWSYNLGSLPGICSPVLGDIDNDGDLEIFIRGGKNSEYIYCLDHEGGLIWSFNAALSIGTSAALGDINNDGYLEIVFGSINGGLYCLDRNGNRIWSYYAGTGFWSSPILGDIDNDGKIEVIVC